MTQTESWESNKIAFKVFSKNLASNYSNNYIHRLGEEIFVPYWKSIFVQSNDTDGGEGSSQQLTSSLLTVNEQNFRDITFTANVQHGLPDVSKAVRNLEQSFRSGGVPPMDDNDKNTGPGISSRDPKKTTNKKSAGSSKKRKGSAGPEKNSNNKRPKAFDLDSTLPEPLLQSLNTRFFKDKLPSDVEARKIFEFMTHHKPLPVEVS